jgi:protein tyrosine phosphatase (PTP) superfamily phosphohydrolase (DUF442 family)
MSGGHVYSQEEMVPDVTVFFAKENKIFFNPEKASNVEYAITGFNRVVDDGKPFERLYKDNPLHKPGYDVLDPRTSIGIDKENNWLILIVVDGRSAASQGVSLMELADIFIENHATTAFNMDGGGSTTIVTEDKGILNTPSDGNERPVANHIGIYAEKMKSILINPPDGADGTGTQGQGGASTPGGDDGSSIPKYRVVSTGIGAGGQPSADGYKWLASQGYKTVVDVQGIDNSKAANAAGLKYIYLPYNGNPPSSSWADSVVSAMSNAANRPVYLHCQYGEHRTGVAIALYREQVEGVCYQQAYDELMRWADNYFPGTPSEKTAVFDMIKSYAKC